LLPGRAACTGTAALIGAAVSERSMTATKALLARWVRIVSAPISSVSSVSSGTDCSSSDAYRHSTGYGSTTVTSTIDTTTINASAMKAAVISANATHANASSICEGVS
jgi:hypothetical protein